MRNEQEVRTNAGKLVGKIVTTARGSYFVQVLRARRGDCVNIGMRFPDTPAIDYGKIAGKSPEISDYKEPWL